jgi:hypothetical protein
LGPVALTANDSFLQTLGFGCLGLDSDNPASAVGGRIRLEGVLAATDLEEEPVEAILSDIGNLGLINISERNPRLYCCPG